MGGEQVSSVRMGQISIPIVIRLEEADRDDLFKLRNVYVGHAGERPIHLSDVADVRVTKTPHSINRENARRQVVVQHNVQGRPLSEVVADVERALAPIRADLETLPGSYGVSIGGQFEAQRNASRTIAILSLVSLAGMFLILFMHFRSARLSALVLVSRPIAFIGAITFVVATGQDISVATLVGLIALLGVSTRNAILLVDHYLHLMRDEMMEFGLPLVVRAGQERAIPILMTALTSGIGLVPLALAGGQPGRELLYPVATVIIGGLVSSTLLDFVVTPILFLGFGKKAIEQTRSSRVRAGPVDAVEGSHLTERPADTIIARVPACLRARPRYSLASMITGARHHHRHHHHHPLGAG